MEKVTVQEIGALLAELKNPQTFLATVDASGAPQVRPVTVMHHSGRFYFATSRASRKVSHIARDRRVEFVTPFKEGDNGGYLRVQGVVNEIKELELVETVTKKCKYPVQNYWKGIDDPDFFFFQVVPERVEFMKPGAETAIEVTSEFSE
jgi:general stress protein 26